jgi:hypothetical protein
MHFKPAWDHWNETHDKLVEDLRYRIQFYQAYRTSFEIPYGVCTYGCPTWSVESVLALSTSFSAQLNVKDTFAGFDYSLPPPTPHAAS